MNNVKVSVIIPVYNAEKYLRQCLDSIINQTLKEIEIICVDDGSTDSSLEILKEYEKKDERVQIIQQKNQFAGVARNNGLKVATGDWVTFIDSDDFCELIGLENLYKIAEENELDFIKCSSKCFNEALQQYENSDWYTNKKAENFFNKVTCFDEYPDILYGICDTPWSGLYKMSFVKENNIYFPNFQCVNDRSFFVKCLLKAKRIMVTNICFVHHRVERAGSLVYQKHYHFDCQIKHYNRVKAILSEIANDKYTKFALRKEITSLVYWYKTLIQRKLNTFNINNLMIEFYKNFDIEDVGEDFLRTFVYKNIWADISKIKAIELYSEEIESPKITVIIPVYNTKKYLCYCIESVLRQTLKDFEIICIDDNSNDGSYEVLLEYAAADKRIKVLKNEQKGVAYARYLGCCMARSQYVQFLDSDDWLDEHALESLYEQQLLIDYDICSFEYYNYDNNVNNVINKVSGIEKEFLPNKKVFNYNDCKEKIFQIITPSLVLKCYRKDFIKSFLINALDLNGTEDLPIACYSAIFATKIIHLSKPLYYYRRNRENSLETSKDKYSLNFVKGYKRLLELISKEDFYEDLSISYVNRALRGCIYELLSKKTEEGFYLTYKFLKEEGFKELKILGYSESIYYKKTDYEILKYITNYEYIFSRADLLSLSDFKVDDKKKESILNKYKFKYKLERVRNGVPAEIILDKRNVDFRPYISVIVPVYNTALYLRSCLDSLKAQSLQNIEIICVNDGSTDDSLHILERYAKGDNHFVILSQENAGLSVARNTGAKFAKGEYLYFCDSDDMLQDIALEKLYEKAKKENLDMIFFNAKLLFQNEEMVDEGKIKYYERKNNYEGIWTGKSLMHAMLENNEYLPSACLSIVKKEYFYKNNLWFIPGILHEDQVYTFKAMYDADRVGYLKNKFYIRRMRSNSIMTSNKAFTHVYGYFYSALELMNYSNKINLLQEDMNLFENILNRLISNAFKIYNTLSNEDKNIRNIMSVYEQIQFKNLVLNYKHASNNKNIVERKNSLSLEKSENNKQEKQLKADLAKTQKELKKYKKQLEDVKSGYSFRIGRVITFIPRKIRGGIKCYREHGIKYTFNRMLVHLHLK